MGTYAQLISSVATVAMAVIWLLYLHLFYRDYRSRRLPRLIIQQADALQPRDYCALVNMSNMHMDILCVFVVALSAHGEKCRQLRQADHEATGQADQPTQKPRPSPLKHGPLAPGGYILLGTFQELLGWVADGDALGAGERPESLEIRVVFFHGMRDQPVGSYRTFRLIYENNSVTRAMPDTLHTPHLRTRRHRGRVERWYRQSLETT